MSDRHRLPLGLGGSVVVLLGLGLLAVLGLLALCGRPAPGPVHASPVATTTAQPASPRPSPRVSPTRVPFPIMPTFEPPPGFPAGGNGKG